MTRHRVDPVFAAQLVVATAAVAAFPGATAWELGERVPAGADGTAGDRRLLAGADRAAGVTPARMVELLRELERRGEVRCVRPREERVPWRWEPAPPRPAPVAAPDEAVPWPEAPR